MKRTWIFSAMIAMTALLVVGGFNPAHALEAKMSGQINQMVLWADDGDQDDFFIADNDSSSTRIRFTGEEAFGAVKVGVQFEIEAQRNASNRLTMNQNNEGSYNGSETGFEWNDRWLNVYFDTKFGKFEIGKGDTAANNTTEVDLSGTSVVTYSDMTATGGSFAWKNDIGGAIGQSISQTHYNFDGILSRSERVRYNTPTFAGLYAAGSVSNGDGWDSSLWYAAEVYGKLAAAVGYTKPQSRAEGTDYQLAGSVSWLMPFGLNLTAAYGMREYEAANRDSADGWYGKIGYKTGIHAVSMEYGLTQDYYAAGYDGTVWGAAYVINPWKPVELYVAYRNYSLDVDVAGIGNPDDIQEAMLGTRVKFLEGINMKKSIALIPILVLAAVLVSGCAQPKPFKYHSGNEIPEGPGLFSKEKGEFTLYDSDKQKDAPQPQSDGAPAAAAAAAPAMTAPSPDSKEFQQFQEWKKEQQEFEAFQEWKKTQQGSREYEEFQEWKRWKAYSDWMESQKKAPVKP